MAGVTALRQHPSPQAFSDTPLLPQGRAGCEGRGCVQFCPPGMSGDILGVTTRKAPGTEAGDSHTLRGPASGSTAGQQALSQQAGRRSGGGDGNQQHTHEDQTGRMGSRWPGRAPWRNRVMGSDQPSKTGVKNSRRGNSSCRGAKEQKEWVGRGPGGWGLQPGWVWHCAWAPQGRNCRAPTGT